jgi:hypothetical protein
MVLQDSSDKMEMLDEMADVEAKEPMVMQEIEESQAKMVLRDQLD